MKKGISQEMLKLVACLTMLIDHIGYEIIYPIYASIPVTSIGSQQAAGMLHALYLLCRSIGRIALPIFAFLLVEGVHHTRDRKRYALRLTTGVLLAEIPYNLMVSGSISCGQQSVMATLLLGFLAVHYMEKCHTPTMKALTVLPFALLAEVFRTDYGWTGVVLIAVFELSRQMYAVNLIRTGAMIVLFHYMPSHIFWIGSISVPMQVLGAFSMLFISNYDGRKVTKNKAVQWGFYLFYPVHMLALWAIGTALPKILLLGVSVAI